MIHTHYMPDLPTARREAPFTLNHRILPAWLCPRLLEDPVGRLVTRIGMAAPVSEFDPEETILAFGSLA
jgi:hypothetical protein